MDSYSLASYLSKRLKYAYKPHGQGSMPYSFRMLCYAFLPKRLNALFAQRNFPGKDVAAWISS